MQWLDNQLGIYFDEGLENKKEVLEDEFVLKNCMQMHDAFVDGRHLVAIEFNTTEDREHFLSYYNAPEGAEIVT